MAYGRDSGDQKVMGLCVRESHSVGLLATNGLLKLCRRTTLSRMLDAKNSGHLRAPPSIFTFDRSAWFQRAAVAVERCCVPRRGVEYSSKSVGDSTRCASTSLCKVRAGHSLSTTRIAAVSPKSSSSLRTSQPPKLFAVLTNVCCIPVHFASFHVPSEYILASSPMMWIQCLRLRSCGSR